MKIYVPDIASLLVELGISAEDQGKYVVAAIARVIGYRLPVPADAVIGEASNYYKEELAPRVSAALDAIVERIPVDYEAVLALTYAIWDVRYSIVHRPVGPSGWVMLDACINLGTVRPDVPFTDPTVQRLSRILNDNVDES